jgi:4'-phosphopantetheinyl transferase
LEEIQIQRTPEGKPFWKRPLAYIKDETTRQWNFNISHHGTLVVLVSDTTFLIGCDVVQLTEQPHGFFFSKEKEKNKFFSSFRHHFGPNEWSQIYAKKSSSTTNTTNSSSCLENFYRFWSLKESYIKAIGIGLGFDLLRVQFQLEEIEEEMQKKYVMYLDGNKAIQWDFETKEMLENQYHISVARGPHDEIWNSKQSAIIPCSNSSSSHNSHRHSIIRPTRVTIPWCQVTFQDLIQLK